MIKVSALRTNKPVKGISGLSREHWSVVDSDFEVWECIDRRQYFIVWKTGEVRGVPFENVLWSEYCPNQAPVGVPRFGECNELSKMPKIEPAVHPEEKRGPGRPPKMMA